MPKRRLTDEQVAEIRQRAAEGELQSALATEYGVNAAHISDIVGMRRRTHKRVPIEPPS